MDFNEVYHFLFETMPGIAVLIGAGMVVCLIVAILSERGIRKKYTNHEKTEDDWSLFDDDEEGEES